jgi:flagellar hook-basal body complex protein FliE
MINSISNLPSSMPLTLSGANKPTAAQDSFKNYLLDSIQQVNTMQKDADTAVEQLMTGGDANPAEVLTAVQKADLAFKLMIQVRNKLVSAYDEIQAIRV